MNCLIVAIVFVLVIQETLGFDKRVLENPDFFEGDIVPNADMVMRRDEASKGVTPRLSIINPDGLWKNKTVYLLNDMPSEWQKRNNHILNRAIHDIESKTCIRFKKQLTRNQGWWSDSKNNDYIRIFNGTGCWSFVGRQGGEQNLSLGIGCNAKGLVIHELMHALGFFHKHSQPDREQYLNIHWQNIHPDMTKEFQIVNGRVFVKGFDMMSIMLYGPDSFSKKPGLTTISRKDGGRLMQVWDKPGLTAQDAFSINSLYRCEGY